MTNAPLIGSIERNHLNIFALFFVVIIHDTTMSRLCNGTMKQKKIFNVEIIQELDFMTLN